ncbi:MAG: hypothetical protein Q8L55_08255 [Phycisphaerales bacterium]|nr:hypothetical protein [Phycisphaerales bacterium]
MKNKISRKWLIAAFSVMMGGVHLGAPLFAQALPPGVNGAIWNIDDPLNRSEVGAYLQLWSSGLAPGGNPAPANDYVFTHQLPSMFDAVCSRELVLFRTLYGHRLNEGAFAAPYYGVWDLLHDDAAVRTQFVRYFTEKRLATPLDGDQQALAKHLAAIQDAWFVGDKYDIFGDVTLVEQELISNNLKEKTPPVPAVPPAPRAPDPTPEALKCFEYWLKQSAIASRIMDCLVRAGVTGWRLDTNNPDTKIPDFDCDDYAYIEMAWLRQMLKGRWLDAEYQIYGYSRQCPPDYGVHGHAVLLVRQGGYVWIIDPMSNQIIGPFKEPISDDEIKRLIRELMKGLYGNICENPFDENVWPFKPGTHPHDRYPKKENPPWQEDKGLPTGHPRKGDPHKDMWERFKQKLAECCAAAAPATPPATPPAAPPAGCDPLFTPPATAPDPCNPENYLWPRS